MIELSLEYLKRDFIVSLAIFLTHLIFKNCILSYLVKIHIIVQKKVGPVGF